MLTPATASWVVHEGTDALDVQSLLSNREGSWSERAIAVCASKHRFEEVKQDLLIFFHNLHQIVQNCSALK